MKRVLLWCSIATALAILLRVFVLTGDNKHDFYVTTYLKNIHYGGMDGIITTFAVVAGGEGASLTPRVTLVMGFASLFADAISMGVGEFVSAQAELEVARSCVANRVGQTQRAKLRQALADKAGFDEGDVNRIIDLLESEPALLARSREDALLLEFGESSTPFKQGVVTFVAFVLFGSVPLLAYVNQAHKLKKSTSKMFMLAVLLTGITLFALGAIKSSSIIDVEENWIMAGLKMFFFGEATAGTAYFIGWFVEQLVDTKETAEATDSAVKARSKSNASLVPSTSNASTLASQRSILSPPTTPTTPTVRRTRSSSQRRRRSAARMR